MDQMHAVAGIDPHKNTATVAVVDSCGSQPGTSQLSVVSR
jgi:hypothetical protein